MRTLFTFCVALAPLLAAAVECPGDYEDYGVNGDRCFLFSPDNQTWTMSYIACLTSAGGIGKPGDLLSVPDASSFYPLDYYVRSSGQKHRTGLLNVGGHFGWSDGTAYDPSLDQFIAPNASDDLYGYISSDDGLLHFDDGQSELPYICYVDMSEPPPPPTTQAPPPPCEEGWQQYGDTCYLFSTDQQYWPSAGHACHVEDAELISITDSELLTFLLLTADPATTYWIGLEDQNGTYVWEDGTSTDTVDDIIVPYLDDWSKGNDCVALLVSNFPTPLIHLPCLTLQNYICYKPAATDSFYVPENFEFWL